MVYDWLYLKHTNNLSLFIDDLFIGVYTEKDIIFLLINLLKFRKTYNSDDLWKETFKGTFAGLQLYTKYNPED